MRNDLGRFTLRNLRVLLITCAIGLLGLASLAATELKQLKLNYDLTGFLAKTDKSLATESEMNKKYRLSSDPTILVVAHRDAGWLEPASIRELESLTSEISSITNVKSVMSLTRLETVIADKQDIRIGRMMDHFKTIDWRRLIGTSAIASPLLLSRDEKLASIIVTTESNAATLGVADSIRKKLDQSLKREAYNQNSFQYELAGVSLVQSEMSNALNHEFVMLGGLGVVVAAGSLVLLFSGYTGFLIALLTALMANTLVLGALSYFGFAIGILSLSLPIVIAVQTLSLTVHILFTYREVRHEHSRQDTWIKTFQRLFFPNLIVSIATGLGFLVLTGSPVDAMREFGWIVSFSSIILWVSTTVVAFLVLFFAPEPRLRSFVSGQARWVLLFTRNSRLTLAGFAMVLLISLGSGMKLNYSHKLFDLNTPTAQSIAKVDKNLGGMLPVEIELRLPEGHESWTDTLRLKQLSSALAEIRKLPNVATAYGAPDVLGLAPTTDPAELMLLLELSSTNPLRHFLRKEGSATRFQLRLRDATSHEIEKAISKTVSILSASTQLAASQITVSGWGSYVHRMNQSLAQGLMNGFWEALLAIAIVLAVAFRSIRWSIAAIIPSVLPPLLLLAGLSMTRLEVKPGLAVVFTIALGFAFINSIYLLQRLKSLFEESEKFLESVPNGERNARWRKLVEKSFWQESQSCLLASLVLVTGFVSLCFSQFEVSRSFGIAMVISMIFGMIGDLVLLPALLYQFPQLLLGGKMPASKNSENTSLGGLITSLSRSRATLWALITGAALTTALFGLPSAASVDSAGDFLKSFATEAAKRVYPKDKKLARDESVEIELINIDPGGETETRKVEVSRITLGKGSKSESRVLAKVIAPKTLRGTSVLTITDGTSQNRWIYLPSSKSVRRVTGGDETHAPILGSELSTEDLEFGQIDGATAKLVGRENGIVRIETKIRSKDSAYSSCTALFDEKTYLFKSADCLDKKGQPVKSIKVLNYRFLKGQVARPTEMEITNLKTKRMSRVRFSEQRMGTGLSSVQFTPESMRD